MSLPTELSLEDGIPADDGSIIYDSSDDASICNQVIEANVLGEKTYYNRNIILIENAEAPHEYTFEFDLPKGYKLCSATEYNIQEFRYFKDNKEMLLESGFSEKEYNNMLSQYKNPSKEIYIVDNNYEIVEVIEAAWAKDANGNSITTYYRINNNCLTQYVNFHGNNDFPIVADLAAHPVKYKYFSLKKSSVKKLRDKYETSTRSTIVGYIASVALTNFPILSIGLSSVTYVSTLYAVENHKLWKKYMMASREIKTW